MVQSANERSVWDSDAYQRGKGEFQIPHFDVHDVDADVQAILMLAIPTLVKIAGPDVIVTTADPGLVATTVMREASGLMSLVIK